VQIKDFTLSRLSPLLVDVVWQRVLKAKKPACLIAGVVWLWNIVGILGIMNAKIMILKYIFSSKERSFRFADVVGVDWQRKTWSGEDMERFGMNTAKSLLGKNVNLHLKDGSVIVNVLLSKIEKDEYERKAFVECVPYGDRNAFRIALKSVAWAEMLNLNLILVSG
jgi:hypothetical protein